MMKARIWTSRNTINYLFDKAATKLVEQAGRLGLTLDKDETLAQLKADNADIAAIKYSDADRVKHLNMCASVGGFPSSLIPT
jgi:hypothetical protein